MLIRCQSLNSLFSNAVKLATSLAESGISAYSIIYTSEEKS